MTKAEERRQSPRILTRVLVDFESMDTYLYDYSNDISEGGIFIETEKPFDLNTEITLRFTLPSVDRVFEIKGRVAWLNQPDKKGDLPAPRLARGMGVEFKKMDNVDLKIIQKHIQEVMDRALKDPNFDPGNQ